MTHQYISNAQGTRLAYTLEGEGPLVMLIMGLGMPGSMWRPLADRLLAQNFSVLIPDNRGTGHSSITTKPWRMTDMGDDAATILRHIDRGPALVCGVSMGGMVTQNLAIRHPDLVRSLVLCNTTCGLPTGKFLNPQALYLLLRLALFPNSATPQTVQKLLAHRDVSMESMDSYKTRITQVMQETPTSPKGMLFHLLASASHNTGKNLHQIKVPTMIVAADGDFLMPNENSKILATLIPNAQLRMVAGAGHILPHSHPADLEQAILDIHADSL